MKRKRKQVTTPQGNFQRTMSRRSSSLVTVNLDDETTDEGVERPDSITSVIQIDNDNVINSASDGLSRSERIFHIVVNADPQKDLTVEENVSTGCCRKPTSWLETCKRERINFKCCDQISQFFTTKLKQLDTKLTSKSGNSYLETYFLYANGCGVSPFHFDKNKQRVVWLKKVPYYIVNGLAAVNTAVLVKFFIEDITVAHKEMSTDIRQHLRNSLLAANVLLRAGFFVSLQLYPDKYSKMIRTISASSYSKHLYTVNVFILSSLICGASFSLNLILTNVGLLGGFENYLIENAEDMKWTFCPQIICPPTEPKELNSTTIVLGLLGWAAKFAGGLLTQIARDGIFFAALALYKSANAFRFKRRIKNATSVDNAITIGREILNDYKWIKKISKHINSAFNIVFRFFLLANIFMFAVFLDDWFSPNAHKVVKCVRLANVIFVCITFYYANQTAKTGERFRDWMKKDKNRKIMGLSEYNVLTENASSIGFGRGALFIYDSTLIGIASVVAAYYFGIVETRPQHDNELENCCARCPNFNNSTVL